MKIYLLILVFTISSCAQILSPSKTLISDENAIKIEYQHVAKKDEVFKYSISPNEIKNPIPIPGEFTLLGNKLYQIETKLIDLGDSIYSFNLSQFPKTDLDRIRVFHLYPEIFSPNGYQWEDCTILPGNWQSDEMISQERKARRTNFLPNNYKNYISCISDNKMESVETFAVVSLNKPLQTEKSTNLKISLTETESSDNRVSYKLTVKNEGGKNVSEVNLISNFDLDTQLISAKPNQGSCEKARIGNSQGSSKCFLGKLDVNQTAIIEFTGEFVKTPMGSSNPNIPPDQRRKNQNWLISGYFKEKVEDLILSQNRFCFTPFLNDDCN